MIIRLFRSRFFGQYLALFLLTILLWLDVLVYPELLNGLQDGFTQSWLNELAGRYLRAAILVSVFVLFIQALLFNQILENYRITERNQLITAALYILMMSSAPFLVQPNKFILVNFLMILVLYRIFDIAGKKEPLSTVFDMGILVGLASLIHFPMLYFLAFVWLCLIIHHNFSLRTWLISIVAFLMPYIFLAVLFFWQDRLGQQFGILLDQFGFVTSFSIDTGIYIYFIWPLFFLLILSGIGRVVKSITENTIEVRKNFRVLIIFLVFVLLTGFFSGPDLKFHLVMAVIPLVSFLSAYLSQSRKIFWSEIIVALIMITIFAGKLMNFS